MKTVTQRMNEVLEAMDESPTAPGEIDLANMIPQIELMAQTMGVDFADEDAIDEFLVVLKQAATTKSSLLKQKMKHWSSAKATKAVKAAKASL